LSTARSLSSLSSPRDFKFSTFEHPQHPQPRLGIFPGPRCVLRSPGRPGALRLPGTALLYHTTEYHPDFIVRSESSVCQFPIRLKLAILSSFCKAVTTEPGGAVGPCQWINIIKMHCRHVHCCVKCAPHWGRSLSDGGHTVKYSRASLLVQRQRKHGTP
jgi:hypothetical protein